MKCENFLTQMNQNEEDETMEDIELEDEEEKLLQEESATLLGRKKKGFKNPKNSNFKYFI